MLLPAQVEEVRRLLAEGGRSQREIAKLTGVSRGTIGAIASGKRRDREPRPEEDFSLRHGPVVRCPECGGKVYSPCILCRTRKLKNEERADRRRTADRSAVSARDERRRADPTFTV
jgi:transcriptional regulator with XRE-family HTH domain